MSTYNKKSDSQFVWTKFILLFGGLVAIPSFLYLTYWSFRETLEWFSFLDFSSTIADKNPSDYVPLALALVFQYGQGPVLYIRMVFKKRYSQLTDSISRSHNPEVEREAASAWMSMLIAGCVFVIFAVIDAWTNIDQMWIGLEVKEAQGFFVGLDKYIFTAAIGVVMVMIEELLGLVISMTSNVFNDIRQVYGYSRIAWLDMFGKIAEEGLSGRSAQRPYRQDSRPRFQQNGPPSHSRQQNRQGFPPHFVPPDSRTSDNMYIGGNDFPRDIGGDRL